MFELLANIIVYQWLAFPAESQLAATIHFFIMDVTKIFVMLVIIIYLMGLLRALISPERRPVMSII